MNKELLKKAIKDSGITQTYLAKKIGMTYQGLWYLMTKGKKLTIDQAMIIKHEARIDDETWEKIIKG